MKNMIFIVILTLLSCAKVPLDHMTLSSQTPTEGEPESIGFYSLGCLKGAVSLPPSGPGFQVMRLSRGRFWGHPKLINYLQKSSKKILRKTGKKILLGDLGHAKGAPSLTGHNSHQTGLDVDIWFKTIKKNRILDLAERETINAPTFLISREKVDEEKWGREHWEILKILSEGEEVQRIFINPAIKKLLCLKKKNMFTVNEMAKIRPWYRHDDHFHVRLRCPKNSANCTHQKDPILKDGCDEELDWWFTEEGKEKIEPWDHYKYFKEKREKLPEQCKAMLNHD